MNKFQTLIGFAAVACVALVACDQKKKAAAAEDAQATALTEELKHEAMSLYERIKLESDNTHEAMREEDGSLPVNYFVPIEWAERAQTTHQKCALIGFYSVDCRYDRIIYGNRNDNKERIAALAGLLAATGMHSKTVDTDSITALNKSEFIRETSKFTVGSFREAMESNIADNYVTTAVYTMVEQTLNQQYLKELKGAGDEAAMLEDMKRDEGSLRDLVKLVDLFRPHYASLDSLAPVTDRMKAVLAAEGAAKDSAFLDYFNYVKDLRTHFFDTILEQ